MCYIKWLQSDFKNEMCYIKWLQKKEKNVPWCYSFDWIFVCTGIRTCICIYRGIFNTLHTHTQQHTATHCNTLQHTELHCSSQFRWKIWRFMGFAGTKIKLLVWLLMQKECSSFVCNSQGVVYHSHWSEWLRTYLYSVILVKLDLLPANTKNMTVNLFVDGQSAISRILGGFFCSRLVWDRCQKTALSSVIRLYPLSPLSLSFSFFLSLSLFFSLFLSPSLSFWLSLLHIHTW